MNNYVDYRIIACASVLFFFSQKTAYEMRISDWSSDVCSSDLTDPRRFRRRGVKPGQDEKLAGACGRDIPEPNAFAVQFLLFRLARGEIGRASCRERVVQYVSISEVSVS